MHPWIRRVRDAPARIAYRALNTSVLRTHFAKRHASAIDTYKSSIPALSDVETSIVGGLSCDGYFITTLEDLASGGDLDLLDRSTALAARYNEPAYRNALHGGNGNLIPPDAIFEDESIFCWGLNDQLLNIIEAYLKLPAAYDGVQFNYTVSGAQNVSTERWHRDWECRSVIKVAVYCNDIDHSNGPFQLVSRDHSQGRDANGYDYNLMDDKTLIATLGNDCTRDIVTCVGSAGTVVFTDTGRYFHRGQAPRTSDRKILFYSYFARPPRHPFFCERSGLSRKQVAKLAKNMAARPKAAALWRKDVPVLLRMIPPAML
jgi:Phytanoyl-CoA dioxygenase (PhyH)